MTKIAYFSFRPRKRRRRRIIKKMRRLNSLTLISGVIMMTMMVFNCESITKINNNTCDHSIFDKEARLYSKFVRSSNANAIFYFARFTAFSQLVLACNRTYNTTQMVEFVPTRRLLVDKSLQLAKLMDSAHLKSLECLILVNTKGFDLNYHQVVEVSHGQKN